MTEHEDADTAFGTTGQVPPARRGSRDERRESTLRALATGQDAHCAYCGEPLPPLPPRGGRPTPYCPPDPERYGNWGAKTISCAMLDEHREIWTRVYGADQPMTHLDVHALDERLAALRSVLDPTREEIAALQAHASSELATALTARGSAEAERDHAAEQARAALADRDRAAADAAEARTETDTARTEQSAAQQRAEQAAQDRDQALADKAAAERVAEQAQSDRQNALDQAAAAHQRITDLQNALAEQRSGALEQQDRLRREHDQASRQLHEQLTAVHEQRMREQETEHAERLAAAQAGADERIAELTDRLTAATRGYAESLGPLHEQLTTVREQLTGRTATATAAQRRFEELRDGLRHALDSQPRVEDADHGETLRQKLRALLPETTPVPDGAADDLAAPDPDRPSPPRN
ncbi:hypothetical protein [Saccharopolyspora gloriosae]|uniref:hypothetical protein n=1 Tax=Saccharopolyspora gloriosae TaxID=455344 RepID=UPI001FB5CAB9|nr:hypothetical protein [Saccharopolyspora gloriosae]